MQLAGRLMCIGSHVMVLILEIRQVRGGAEL